MFSRLYRFFGTSLLLFAALGAIAARPVGHHPGVTAEAWHLFVHGGEMSDCLQGMQVSFLNGKIFLRIPIRATLATVYLRRPEETQRFRRLFLPWSGPITLATDRLFVRMGALTLEAFDNHRYGLRGNLKKLNIDIQCHDTKPGIDVGRIHLGAGRYARESIHTGLRCTGQVRTPQRTCRIDGPGWLQIMWGDAPVERIRTTVMQIHWENGTETLLSGVADPKQPEFFRIDVSPDGTFRRTQRVQIRPQRYDYHPANGRPYPVAWRVRDPDIPGEIRISRDCTDPWASAYGRHWMECMIRATRHRPDATVLHGRGFVYAR